MTTQEIKTSNTQHGAQPLTGNLWKQMGAWVLPVLPVFLFGLVWWNYAVNIPKWDDHALRAFLFYFDQETTLTGKIYQLFRQHNEHRIVYDRLVSIIDYKLFGKLNYVHLMFVGNLSLVGLLWIFSAVLRRSRPGLSGQWVVYATPIAWFLFNLSQWENMFWGMAALQNFSVVLWVLATFYFLSYTKHWKLALVASVLATITSGNGLMVWPLGMLILLVRLPAYQTKDGRYSFQPLLGWGIGAILVIGLYFTGFEKPEGVKYVKPGVIELSKGWLAVVGAAAEAIPSNFSLRNSILLGGLIAFLTLGIIFWSFIANRSKLGKLGRHAIVPRSHPLDANEAVSSLTIFFVSCAAFILGTAAVVAWARTGAGIDLLITSRYKMYSLTALALLYVYFAVSLPNRIANGWALGGLIGSVFFAGLSYFAFLDETVWWRHWNTTNQFNSTHSSNSPAFSSDSVSQHYTPAIPAFYDKGLQVVYGPADQQLVTLQVQKIVGGFSIQNSDLPAQKPGDAGAYLLARSAKRTYLFPVWQNHQSIVAARFMPKNLFTKGFTSSLLASQMDAATYQLFVLTVSADGTCRLHPTSQVITSAGPSGIEEAKNW